mgnify:CR=1 FL=1
MKVYEVWHAVPADFHAVRPIENFPLAGRSVHPALIRAYGTVKLACAKTNRSLGSWPDAAKADAKSKPDAVAARAAGKILAHHEAQGFRVRAARMVRLGTAQAEAFYAVHRERPFFRPLVTFMTSGPCIPLALEKADAVPLGPRARVVAQRGERPGQIAQFDTHSRETTGAHHAPLEAALTERV